MSYEYVGGSTEPTTLHLGTKRLENKLVTTVEFQESTKSCDKFAFKSSRSRSCGL